MKKIAIGFLAVISMGTLTACGKPQGEREKITQEVAGDYYLDLSELGMNLTVYLNLSEYGEFKLSGTLEYATDKGSGVFSETEGGYLMSYSFINGAAVTASDGYMSQFTVQADKSLLFTSEYLYYGSTHIGTVAESDENVHLVAIPVTAEYEEPDNESVFTAGVYTAVYETGGVTYRHAVSFFQDATYLHFAYFETDGALRFMSETGTYSVVNDQLAMVTEADATNRNSCTVLSETELTLSVMAFPDAEERESLSFVKDERQTRIGVFAGKVEGYDAILTLYADGSYTAQANGVSETGMVAVNSAEGVFKQYPDSLTDGARGLTYVNTVAAGSIGYENQKIKIENVRLRTSDTVYTRYSCVLTETEEE